MTKTVKVEPRHLELCAVKAETVQDLSFDEFDALKNWCDFQIYGLWADLTVQEVLNVYRVSAEYISFEDWLQEEPEAAIKAYNSVVQPSNRLNVT